MIKKHNRVFLFLQGPISPFFNQLATEILKKSDSQVYKIQFCYSDRLWWKYDLIKYNDELENFGSFVSKVIKDYDVTDLVLLGDCRPYHRIAIESVTNIKSFNVWTFEEGYLRPNTITLALNTRTNGLLKSFDSNKAYDTEKYIRNIKTSLFTRLRWDFCYHVLNFFFRKRFKYYEHHRKAKIWQEYLGWLKRFSFKFCIYTPFLLSKEIDRLKQEKYFLVPLQLSHDYQIIKYSKYEDILEVIDEILESFRKNTCDNSKLVFKVHPLDTFVINPVKYIKKRIKNDHYFKDKVMIIDGGDIKDLIKRASGIITVNSTVGLLSLIHSKPTCVLGQAIYKIEDICCDNLDNFWRELKQPNDEKVNNLVKYLMNEFLFNGNFYSVEGIRLSTPILAQSILNRGRNDLQK